MTTIFNKFKYVFMDFKGKDFVVDDVLAHGQKLGIYHGRTTYKNALYRFEANGYWEMMV